MTEHKVFTTYPDPWRQLDAVRAQRDEALEAYRVADEDRSRRARERDEIASALGDERDELRRKLRQAHAERDCWRGEAERTTAELERIRASTSRRPDYVLLRLRDGAAETLEITDYEVMLDGEVGVTARARGGDK